MGSRRGSTDSAGDLSPAKVDRQASVKLSTAIKAPGNSEQEEAQAIVQAALKVRGKGSILRGWRQELDPDGSLDCNFLEFCQAAKRLQLAVDAPKLFGEDSPESLDLGEVMPELGQLLERFRKFMMEEFGGPSEMCLGFESLEEAKGLNKASDTVIGASLKVLPDPDAVIQACRDAGIVAPPRESAGKGAIVKFINANDDGVECYVPSLSGNYVFAARALSDGGDGMLSEPMFFRGCRHFGFEASDADLNELFCLLDAEEMGAVAAEDVMFLEVDVKKREGALKKAKEKREAQYIKELTAAYRDDVTNALPWHHRRAPRAWNAALFERLPALICERKRDQRAEEHRRRVEARATFMRHISDAFGDPVRAWRRGLDLENRYFCTRPALSKYCSQNGLKVCVPDLWKAFDQDGDGVIRLEEIGPSHSAIFANLQVWSRKMFGNCAAIWDTPEADEIREKCQSKGTWMSDKKMPLRAFGTLLRELGWPLLSKPGIPDAPVLLRGLDFYNCGFLSVVDLEWLDAWEAPPWLSAEPDQQAWEQLREMMMNVFQEPLRAWRRCLDTDDSNCVSYVEFLQAARQLKFHGNVDGAWRYLDRDISGTISLTEFDPAAAELLQSFKQWMENNFGAVEAAFRVMDTDGSGALSFSELKRATKRMPWDGDVGTLFDCLAIAKVPGKRTLSFKDLEFLDSWMPESIQEAVEARATNATTGSHSMSIKSSTPLRRDSAPKTLYKATASPAASSATTRTNTRTLALQEGAKKEAGSSLGSDKLPRIGAPAPSISERGPPPPGGKGGMKSSKHDLNKTYSTQAPSKGWFPPYLMTPATPPPEGLTEGARHSASLPALRGPAQQGQMQSVSAAKERRHRNWAR